MDEGAERLRRLVGELPVGARRRRVPAGLRAEVARYVRSERAAGTTWSRIAAMVGLSEIALRRWCERADEAQRASQSAEWQAMAADAMGLMERYDVTLTAATGEEDDRAY